MTDRMIINRLRKVCHDLSMTDTEFANEYHVDLDNANNAKIFKSVAMLEVIADELEEYEAQEKAKRADKATDQ